MAPSIYTLLIVEDYLADREQYRRFFLNDPSSPYRLLEAESVEEGLDLCQTQTIDAVLLDYSLPDADGLEFLKVLQAQTNINKPPVIMVTGAGDEKIAVQAIKLGAEDYLVKHDLKADRLRLTIQKAIENARLQVKLQQCSDRFRVFIENTLDCIGIYLAIRNESGQITDFKFEYLNAAALESNQMTVADMGRRLCEVFPAIRETGLFDQYCQVVETGQPFIKEDLIYSDMFGEQQLTRAYDVRIHKLDDGFVATWLDVTARKQAELTLQEALQQITTIWESMTDAYVSLDCEWRIIYTNQAATQIIHHLVNLRPQEFLGKPYWEIFPWSVGGMVEQKYRQAVTEQVAVHFEALYQPTLTWFEIHAYPSAAGLGIYFRDINDRKNLEAQRRQAEQERDRFFNLSVDMLAIANFEGYFLRLNPVWEKTLGFTTAELMAQPYLDLVHPADRESTVFTAQGLSEGEDAVNFENRYRCKDGSYRWLSWSAASYIEQNFVYAIARDITEQKQIQSTLEARNQELNGFAYVVSHDLKAPLRGIANLAQWIQEDLKDTLSEEIQQQMTLLQNRANSVQSMINGLLDYARVGRTDTPIEHAVVKELLTNVIDSIAPPASFNITFAPNLPIFHTKRLLLSQVFAHLIDNGVKHHTRPDGSIYISCQEQGDFYEFAVADDGPGVAANHHDRIFMIFQSGSARNSQDSSGIGLSIVKKIVEGEAGKIRLESHPGKGSTFYFTWPKYAETTQVN
jgi:PAS domain S-box-containing protein